MGIEPDVEPAEKIRAHGALHLRTVCGRGMARGVLMLLAVLAFTGCAQHYRLATPADLSRLPVRYGWTGGTVVSVTPWRYLGSRYQTHEFRYYYNRDNPLYYREVSVARGNTVLRFEERAYGDVRQWVTLRSDGQTFYFSLLNLER